MEKNDTKNSSRLHYLCTKQHTGTRQSRLCDAAYDSFPLCNGVCHRASLKAVARLLKVEWKTRRTGCSSIDQHWLCSRMELEMEGDQRLGEGRNLTSLLVSPNLALGCWLFPSWTSRDLLSGSIMCPRLFPYLEPGFFVRLIVATARPLYLLVLYHQPVSGESLGFP